MTNFVLVHGAWQGGWSWNRVVRRLEASRESHGVGQILAVDLPGHGQRASDDVRGITMEHYIEAVTTPVQVGRLGDVVLVGHGFAATFLPRAAMDLEGSVSRVVLIGGELPPEGTSAYDRLTRWQKMMLRLFNAREKGFRYPDFIFRGILCNGLDRASAREVLAQLVPEPFKPWRTPVSRQGFDGRFPTEYAILGRDKAIRTRLQRSYSRSLNGARVHELAAGHGVLFSHADTVAKLLLGEGPTPTT